MPDDCSVAVVWDPAFLTYDFGASHPFSENSRWLAVRLLEETGFFRHPAPRASYRIPKVARANPTELERFHHPEYLELVRRKSGGASTDPLDAGDTPAFRGCFDAASAIAGGTLAGARATRDDPGVHASTPAGGLHHAHPDRASGFCIFNDLAVAIRTMQEESPSLKKIAYVDVDVHHGDGVMYGFYDDGDLLDIDFHQDGRTIFPGTGFLHETGRGDGSGLKVNVPLPPGTGDEIFVPLFEQIVPTMIRRFRPELILLQCGMDAHEGDLLGNLRLTPAAFVRVAGLVHSLAHELCRGRLVVTGGGGYTPQNVSRGLARVALVLAGRDEEGSHRGPLPPVWRTEFERMCGSAAPRTWDDRTGAGPARTAPGFAEKTLATLAEGLGVKWDRSELSAKSDP